VVVGGATLKVASGAESDVVFESASGVFVVGELSVSGCADVVLRLVAVGGVVDSDRGGLINSVVVGVLEDVALGEDEELGLDPAGTTVKLTDVAIV